jgi:hypothetical protein
VYETALWNEPGTPANIQAKLAAFQGLVASNGVPRSAAGYHTAWNDGPRIDAAKGLLFGLQGWNRVNHYAAINAGAQPTFVFALSEDPGITPITGVVRPSPVTDPPGDTPGWIRENGATVAVTGDVEPPGDSEKQSAKLVTLPAGGAPLARAALRREMRPFDAAGPIHGQVWIRVPAPTTGKLRLRSGETGAGNLTIDLAALPANVWTRHALYRSPGGAGNEILGGTSNANLYVESHPDNAAPISFYMWGLQVTQVGTAAGVAGGSPINADLGAEVYDWSADRSVTNFDQKVTVDALQLPALATSTAATGFCLSAAASPQGNLPWTAPFTANRTLLAWVDSPLATTRSAKLYLSGATNTPQASPQICFALSGGTPLCAAIPGSFAPGTKRAITACVDPAGQARLYAEGSATPIAGPAAAGASVPDLSGGSLLVGGQSVLATAPGSEPFHGYVSRAAVCRDSVNVAACQ